jgi:DnaA family protein
MPASRQLPLSLRLNPQATFDDFVAGDNGEPLAWLQALGDGRPEPVTYLWGAAGCGRSHLLQATCRLAADNGFSCAYLPLGDGDVDPARMLEDIDRVALVCLDDIDAIAGDAVAERAAFALCNRLRECHGRLLVAAAAPPAGLAVELPDLRSRLGWGPVFQLGPLDDDGKLRVLAQRATQLGFELSDDAGRYLLARSPRGLGQLLQQLDGIDRAALAAQRRVTVPFLRTYLQGDG